MTDRIPLIYILSNGRSGTTLLDMLLGSARTTWTVGEAQLLPWEIRDSQSPCGCGREVDECPFWREVLRNVPLGESRFPIDFFRERHGGGKALRWPLLPDLIRGRVRDRHRRPAEAYGRVNAEYLSAVLRAARAGQDREVEWLIDASKDPYRLFWLHRSGRFHIHVIHLTKSPEAFVYSMIKSRDTGIYRMVLRMAGRWLVENLLMIRLCHATLSRDRWRHLRYEELASDPMTAQRRLGEWLHVDFPRWEGRVFRAYTNHAISGNEMRWEDTEIRLDERWKKELPVLHRGLTRLITAPLSRSLGY